MTEVRTSSVDSDLLMVTETEKYLWEAFSYIELAVM